MPKSLREAVKLLRISVYPSLVANVLTAWWLAGPPATPLLAFFSVLLTSSCFFFAGMVLNDFFDAKIDAQERPGRPIPSGAVSRMTAGLIGFVLIIAALVGVELTVFATGHSALRLTGWILAALVIGYDSFLKHVPFAGAVCMGACRFVNILFVAAAASGTMRGNIPFYYALGILFYISAVTGISWFEGNEPGYRLKCKRIVGFMLKTLIPIDAAVCLVFVGVVPALLILSLYPVALKLRQIVSMT